MDDGSCRLYLAPSSISDAGLGVYTTRDFKAGGVVHSSDAPEIVVFDRDFHQDSGKPPVPNWAHDSYMWNAEGESKFEADGTGRTIVTLGAMTNTHTYFNNIRTKGWASYDDSKMDRRIDPGAGAFSYHMSDDFVATRDITAGEEVFIDYVDAWLGRREDFIESIPQAEDFNRVDKIVENVMQELINIGNKTSFVVLDDTDSNELAFQMIREVISLYDERAAPLLPKDLSELVSIAVEGKSLAWKTLQHRSVDWILENGQCLDNIVMRRSTIPQAGNGAFASRFLSKGTIVAPGPLLHIINRDTLTMYSFALDENDEYQVTGTQLLLNYCFGHIQSSLLLCPASNAILINHCSSRKSGEGECGTNGPNAAYRWSSMDPETPDWLKMSLESISKEKNRGLSLEIFSTRDIQPGEEIFIDYGSEWEEAWDKHMKDWSPPKKGSSFEESGSVTKMNKRKELLRTVQEVKNGNSYPQNVITACLYWGRDDEDSLKIETLSGEDTYNWDWTDFSEKEAIDTFGIDGSEYVYSEMTFNYSSYWPCDIFQRENDEGSVLTVRILQSHLSKITWWHEANVPRFLTSYPRTSVKFFPKPYMSDQHLPGAFRHHITIQDDIFPAQWKNRPSK